MKLFSILAAAATLMLLGTAPLAAQERQVPLDEQGRVQVIDAGLARQLGLWTAEYPGFVEARLFEDAGGRTVLEITTTVGGETRRERIQLTPAQVAELRASVQARMVAGRVMAPTDQEGRYLLLGQTTLAGLVFYGWAVPEILDVTGSRAAGLGLLTIGTSFFLPFALTQDQPVTFGMANLSRYGVTRGIAHGALLHEAIMGDRTETRCSDGFCWEEETGSRGRLTTSLAFSVAEGIGGYLWARNEEMTAGTAITIVTMGDAGMLAGLGTGLIISPDRNDRLPFALGVVGAAGGIVGGRALAARRDYTWGDADFLYTAGAVGAFTGLATAVVTGVDNARAGTALVMAGGAAGLLLADRLVATTDFSVGQSTLNRLGTVAGGLAGASIGVLMDNPDVAIAGAALGAVGGYMLTYSALAPDARAGRGERFSRWDLMMNPEGLLGLARGQSSSTAVPLVNVSYRLGASSGAR
jgi:hypothetical protein